MLRREGGGMATLIERAIGAARLDVATYEDVEADTTALGQALTVVVAASVLSGIGSAAASGGEGIGLLGGAIAGLIGWFVWAFTIYLVGTKLLATPETQADLGQLLRTTGFAAAPGALGVLGVIPGIGGLVLTVSSLWQLATMVVAVRQALDYSSTGRAIAVCVVGFLVQAAVIFVLMTLFIGGAMAIFGGGGAGPATVTP
jgi:hypothetical protein